MDQRVLAFVKVGLWLADCSPVESHPLLHHHHLLLDVLMPKGLCAALGCALVVPAPALPGWVAGWLRVASAYLPWCGVWVGLLPLAGCALYASSLQPICCWCVPAPCLAGVPLCPVAWAVCPRCLPCPAAWSRYLTLSPWCGCGGLACGGRGFGVCPGCRGGVC